MAPLRPTRNSSASARCGDAELVQAGGDDAPVEAVGVEVEGFGILTPPFVGRVLVAGHAFIKVRDDGVGESGGHERVEIGRPTARNEEVVMGDATPSATSRLSVSR